MGQRLRVCLLLSEVQKLPSAVRSLGLAVIQEQVPKHRSMSTPLWRQFRDSLSIVGVCPEGEGDTACRESGAWAPTTGPSPTLQGSGLAHGVPVHHEFGPLPGNVDCVLWGQCILHIVRFEWIPLVNACPKNMCYMSLGVVGLSHMGSCDVS